MISGFQGGEADLQNISGTLATVTPATFYPSKQVKGSPDGTV